MAFLRQTWTLVSKNLLIVLGRHGLATVVRAFLLPIIITTFLSFARNLFVPPAVFGIGANHPVRTLQDALDATVSVGRDRVAFVHNGFTGGDIERVINSLVPVVTAAGRKASVLENQDDINSICRANLRGVTPCYGAVVFNASPTEGKGGLWNYTIRSDSSLGLGKINVDKDTNDAELYMLPFQHAIDAAITSANRASSGQDPLTNDTMEYPFTDLTKEERADFIRVRYQQSLVSFLGVSFISGMIGIAYHMAGFMASEREIGMSTLIDATMPTRHPWMAQAARLWSYHITFTLVYLPGWIFGAIILRQGVFAHTSVGVVLVYNILSGLALASMTIFGAAFFRRSQLSGVTLTIVFIVLAIIAQSITDPDSGTVAVLSLLFAPSNYTYFVTYLARWEQQQLATNLTETAPTSPWDISGIILWVFLVVQIIVYPILGALLERWLHGTSSNSRNIVTGSSLEGMGEESAVRLEGFTKIYKPGFIRRIFSFIVKPKEPVVAVNGLTLTAGRGQILALLGANGSGKSTTLDSIAGISKPTSGHITIDGTGGLGIAPQKNVLWDELTVMEHLKIFNKLKSPGNHSTKAELCQLISSIDLDNKVKAQSKTLSGGQKRKLQLGMMLTGGSAVCCVDEVSSGLDPLSRRKIWDILLAERGRRTIIMTTHFLDEADLLADHIAILSKGTLRAEGASVQLKDRLGGGYRIHVQRTKDMRSTPDIDGVTKKVGFDLISYIAPSSSLAAQVIKTLEAADITDYRFSGPTIEDVFLQLAEEVRAEAGEPIEETPPATMQASEKHPESEEAVEVDERAKSGLGLLPGRRIGYMRQVAVLFRKRCTIFKGNWFPYVAAFFIPIIAAGLVTLFIKDQQPVGCNPDSQVSRSETQDLFNFTDELFLVGGPSSKFNQDTLAVLLPVYLSSLAQNGSTGSDGGSGGAAKNLFNNITIVDSFEEFNQAVERDRKKISPAGLWLGDADSPPTVAYSASPFEMYSAWFGQSVLDMLLTNTSIASTYVTFDIPWAPNTGNSLQLLVYVGLALSAYPGFFALYPNVERRSNVRGLQYSNGVRTAPLWLAYILFDFGIIIVSTAIVTILFATLSSVWYHVAYLFLVFILYGLATTLLGYLISLFCATQLSAYAFTAAGQAVFFLVYLLAYLSTITFAPVNRVDDYLLLVHFLVSAFAPIGSVMRSLLLALNLFSAACEDKALAPNPGGILQYGGPILYLMVQSAFLFGLIIWLDSGDVGSSFKRLFQRGNKIKGDNPDASDEEVANEQLRVVNSIQSAGEGAPSNTDGLRVLHLTKTFGKNTAVDNVSLGVKRGEVFALLGPNGAGKSTTISLIRGDIKPSVRGGDIFVDDVSVTKNLAAARSHLGVCPQFDAIDQMTVTEHLRFYARVRGIPDIDHNVDAILRAVGLTAFRDRQAHALSGGNKRKLSLGIALMGDPAVLLLDEPSSGLDAAAKRVMWRTLAATVPGRSILLTTHSMEEADALAGRAGILARRMLAMGTVDRLRRRFGNALHVHLVCKGAPRTTDEEVRRVREWVAAEFPEAQIEERTYHGQMRFSIPADSVGRRRGHSGEEITAAAPAAGDSDRSAIGQLVVALEENRKALGIEHYSVSPTTLDQVFLAVVGKHGVKEEGYGEAKKKKWWQWGS